MSSTHIDPVPNILYKFLDAKGSRFFLRNDPALRFKDWNKLNDLMDVLPGARLLRDEEFEAAARDFCAENADVSIEQYVRRQKEIQASIDLSDWEKEIRESFNNQPCTLFICSLTARWDSGPMWSHYAKEHSGIAVGIKASAISRICGTSNAIPREISKVAYDENRPQIGLRRINAEDRASIHKAARTKSKDWEYEQEWRLMSAGDSDEKLAWDDIGEVVLGYSASEEIGKLVTDLPKCVSVYRAYPSPNFHRMDRQLISA